MDTETPETPALTPETEQLPDSPEAPDEQPDAEVDADPEGADQLGDPGKKALASMKDRWRSERDKRRALEQQLAERDRPAEGDNDTEALVRQAESAAMAKANERIVRAEVKAAAAGRFADPGDALRFLDLDQFEVDDDGALDAEEVSDAIEDLLKSKPYLAAQSGKRFHGTADSGARKGNGRPPQLSRSDLQRMSPEKIVAAKNEGRLDELLGITR